MTATTVITPADLVALNREAVKLGLNRVLAEGVIDRLDPEGVNIVTFTIGSEDSIRANLMIKLVDRDEAVTGWLDMSYKSYLALPKVEKRDGEWVKA